MNLTFNQLLETLENDHETGALALASQTLQDFHGFLEQAGPFSRQDLQSMTAQLARARPSMHALENALSRWQEVLGDDFHNNLHQLQAVLDALKQARQQVIRHALTLIKPEMTILVHSRSSLVTGVFEALSQQQIPVSVFATLSAPGHEGRQLAKELSQLHIPVTLITDAEMGLVMPDVDMNLSGCDSWLSDGYFVNKTGTRLQALAAREQHKPFWVLADSFKNSPQSHQNVSLEHQPADALDLPASPGIDGLNIWFETIPTRLITGRVDESGCHHPPAVNEIPPHDRMPL